MNYSCFLNSFNLFSRETAHRRNQFSRSKKSQPSKKVVELYFINPNILFMDNERPDKVIRTQTADAVNRKTAAQDRLKTCNSAKRQMSETTLKLIPIQCRQIGARERRLDEYIKMERVFLKFRKTGEVRTDGGR